MKRKVLMTNVLPSEAYLLILSYCNVNDLITFERVSRQWYKFITETSYTALYCNLAYNYHFNYLLGAQVPQLNILKQAYNDSVKMDYFDIDSSSSVSHGTFGNSNNKQQSQKQFNLISSRVNLNNIAKVRNYKRAAVSFELARRQWNIRPINPQNLVTSSGNLTAITRFRIFQNKKLNNISPPPPPSTFVTVCSAQHAMAIAFTFKVIIFDTTSKCNKLPFINTPSSSLHNSSKESIASMTALIAQVEAASVNNSSASNQNMVQIVNAKLFVMSNAGNASWAYMDPKIKALRKHPASTCYQLLLVTFNSVIGKQFLEIVTIEDLYTYNKTEQEKRRKNKEVDASEQDLLHVHGDESAILDRCLIPLHEHQSPLNHCVSHFDFDPQYQVLVVSLPRTILLYHAQTLISVLAMDPLKTYPTLYDYKSNKSHHSCPFQISQLLQVGSTSSLIQANSSNSIPIYNSKEQVKGLKLMVLESNVANELTYGLFIPVSTAKKLIMINSCVQFPKLKVNHVQQEKTLLNSTMIQVYQKVYFKLSNNLWSGSNDSDSEEEEPYFGLFGDEDDMYPNYETVFPIAEVVFSQSASMIQIEQAKQCEKTVTIHPMISNAVKDHQHKDEYIRSGYMKYMNPLNLSTVYMYDDYNASKTQFIVKEFKWRFENAQSKSYDYHYPYCKNAQHNDDSDQEEENFEIEQQVKNSNAAIAAAFKSCSADFDDTECLEKLKRDAAMMVKKKKLWQQKKKKQQAQMIPVMNHKRIRYANGLLSLHVMDNGCLWLIKILSDKISIKECVVAK